MLQLCVKNLTGGYGDTNIIFDVSFDVKKGQCIGIFGRNGVGKTTLGKLLQGSLKPSSGEITFLGKNCNDQKPSSRRNIGIGYMAQTGMVFDDLTVDENLHLGSNAIDPSYFFERFPRLKERLAQKAGSMSGGERKILAFVRVMSEDTSLVILDEPSEGVQPENISHMQECIKARIAAGGSVILIEQNLTLLTAISDYYIGLDHGEIVLNQPAKNTEHDELLEVLSI